MLNDIIFSDFYFDFLISFINFVLIFIKESVSIIMIEFYDSLINFFQGINGFFFSHSVNLDIDLEAYLSIFVMLFFGETFHLWRDETALRGDSNRAVLDNSDYRNELSQREVPIYIIWHRTIENIFGFFLVFGAIIFCLYLLSFKHNDNVTYINTIIIFRIYSGVTIIFLAYLFFRTYVVKAIDVRNDRSNYFYPDNSDSDS